MTKLLKRLFHLAVAVARLSASIASFLNTLTWNVQDRMYRGRMSLGGSVSDHGYLYPDTEFFMEFSWAVENGRWHCISITPKWPNMHIFLDADGNIDMKKVSGTNVGKLKECQWDLVKP
ncbi:hypothetical protein SOP85_16585 [Pseudomonas sp. YuFO20]|uniref:hypothetical protein n=1 Tax=Pseudomonas sp. YuFO20 TaxID=3095362 RepID=UPI002B248A43|nr:hypothetical protein [Pseudomonas sp. YuFO20]MEB2517047.1 hypothetical protein [Pseudomonas sp. YuFO20]